MACHLRAGILPIPLVCDIKISNKTMQVTGITDVFVTAVTTSLNCSYSYHLPAVLGFGTPGLNGTYKAGLLGDIANDLRIPSKILNVPIGILAGRNRARDSNMTGYLLTFDIQVWVVLLLFLALLSIVLAFLDVASRRMYGNRAVAVESWNEHFWMLFENMFCEASAVPPESSVLRIVSAAWWLAIVVLMNAFSGQMRACLLVKTELEKINTLQDIAARSHLKVYVLKNTVLTRYLESSQGDAERKVWSMIRRDRSDLYGILHFPDEMLHDIVHEKAVVIHADTASQTEVGKFCSGGEIGEFYLGTETMYILKFGSYMNRRMNVTHRQRIKGITTASREAGIFSHEYTLAIPPMDRCRIVEEKHDLTLRDMLSVFYMYAAFTAASALVFLAEMITRCAGRSPRLSKLRRRALM